MTEEDLRRKLTMALRKDHQLVDKDTSSQTLTNDVGSVSGKLGGQLVPGVAEKHLHFLLCKQKFLTGSVDNLQ